MTENESEDIQRSCDGDNFPVFPRRAFQCPLFYTSVAKRSGVTKSALYLREFSLVDLQQLQQFFTCGLSKNDG